MTVVYSDTLYVFIIIIIIFNIFLLQSFINLKQ